MAKRRRFTPKFKAEVVLEALRGETSQAELCRRHNLSENQVSTWHSEIDPIFCKKISWRYIASLLGIDNLDFNSGLLTF